MRRILFCLFIGLCAQVHAAEKKCDELLGDFDAIDCYGQRYEQADIELNRTYKALMVKLDKSDQQLLKDSQRAWLKYKDAEASYIARLQPNEQVGSFERRVYAAANLELLEKRLKFLKDELARQK